MMISIPLIQAIRAQYRLPWTGVHGAIHWARVMETGWRLAELTGARPHVVELFAVFHDARRLNEHSDHDHGRRGAELAVQLRGSSFELSDGDFALLHEACSLHTDGLTDGDTTVQTCWDADRLDLGRVGITPEPRYLCTAAAKSQEMIRWADARACDDFVPVFARETWVSI